MIGNYVDQVERMLRSYNRLPERSPLLSDNQITPEVLDNYIHFFRDCFHLKDWIKSDEDLVDEKTRKKIDDWAKNNKALKYIKSIANATKHLEITNKTNYIDIDFLPKQPLKSRKKVYHLAVGSKKEDFGYDALALATEGVKAWKICFDDNNLYRIDALNRGEIKIVKVTDSSITYNRPKVS